jgi:hypothetical protein
MLHFGCLLARAPHGVARTPFAFSSTPARLGGLKSKSPAAGGSTSPARSEAALLDLYAQAVEPRAPAPPPRPSEATLLAWKGMASLYVKLLWRRHHVLQRDWNRKARLKWAALHALPTEAHRRDALFVEPHVPLELYLPLETPPLAGFHGPEDAARERARVEAMRAAEDARARARVMAEGVKRAAAPKAEVASAGGDFGAARGAGRSRLRALGTFDLGAGAAPPAAEAKGRPPAPPPASAPKKG